MIALLLLAVLAQDDVDTLRERLAKVDGLRGKHRQSRGDKEGAPADWRSRVRIEEALKKLTK